METGRDAADVLGQKRPQTQASSSIEPTASFQIAVLRTQRHRGYLMLTDTPLRCKDFLRSAGMAQGPVRRSALRPEMSAWASLSNRR